MNAPQLTVSFISKQNILQNSYGDILMGRLIIVVCSGASHCTSLNVVHSRVQINVQIWERSQSEQTCCLFSGRAEIRLAGCYTSGFFVSPPKYIFELINTVSWKVTLRQNLSDAHVQQQPEVWSCILHVNGFKFDFLGIISNNQCFFKRCLQSQDRVWSNYAAPKIAGLKKSNKIYSVWLDRCLKAAFY